MLSSPSSSIRKHNNSDTDIYSSSNTAKPVKEGVCFWFAPSGGRDRPTTTTPATPIILNTAVIDKDNCSAFIVSPFDSKAIEFYYTLGKNSKKVNMCAYIVYLHFSELLFNVRSFIFIAVALFSYGTIYAPTFHTSSISE